MLLAAGAPDGRRPGDALKETVAAIKVFERAGSPERR